MSEQIVIGGLILNNWKLHDIAAKLSVSHFSNQNLARVYQEILATKGEFDLITLVDKLGDDWLTPLSDCVSKAAANPNTVGHADIVINRHAARKLTDKLAESINKLSAKVEPQAIIDDLNQFLTAQEVRHDSQIRIISDSFLSFVDELEKRYEAKGQITGLSTGLIDLDQSIQGMQEGNLIIIAGRPAMGKSVLAQNIGQHNAEKGKKVVMFSLEMTEFEIQQRMISSMAGIDYGRIQSAQCISDDDEYTLLANGLHRIKQSNFYIDDSSSLSIHELKSKALAFARKMNGVDLLIVDYLQLLTAKAESRLQEVSVISRELKSLAKALKCPVIALSQLNRSLESRNDKRPMVSDLRESGQLEQDADKIIFIYRDEVYNKDTTAKGLAELLIGKARNCPRKDVICVFDGAKQTFRNADAASYELVERGKSKPQKSNFASRYAK